MKYVNITVEIRDQMTKRKGISSTDSLYTKNEVFY